MLQYKATYDGSEAFVETPFGERLGIHDQRLIDDMSQGLRDGGSISLMTSDRALADCQPLSIFSLQTVDQLARELGFALDKRRFRANLYIDLGSQSGFGEDQFVGHKLRIGTEAVVYVTERDPRCKVITLDPGTSRAEPLVMKQLAREHDGKAGVYGSVVVEGMVRPGDEIVLVSE